MKLVKTAIATLALLVAVETQAPVSARYTVPTNLASEYGSFYLVRQTDSQSSYSYVFEGKAHDSRAGIDYTRTVFLNSAPNYLLEGRFIETGNGESCIGRAVLGLKSNRSGYPLTFVYDSDPSTNQRCSMTRKTYKTQMLNRSNASGTGR